MKLTFFGVRGSTPCAAPSLQRYGGNTSCVVAEVDEAADPIIFDLGTGMRPFGQSIIGDKPFSGDVLLSHLHWDHVQGLPFFGPIDRPGARLNIYGPTQDLGSLKDVFGGMMGPPYFPIRPEDLRGRIEFQDLADDDFMLGKVRVRSRWLRHAGPTLGFRIEHQGLTVAYLSDHGPGMHPEDADDYVPRRVLELCDGVDVLIHDSQYTNEEYERRRHWGHSTVNYAVHVASEAGVKRLVTFHHDPSHTDEEVDLLLQSASDIAERSGLHDVIAGYEGLILKL